MSDYQVGMMTLYAVTFLIATPRGRQWLAMGLMAFLATTVYWRSGLPFASAFALICDAAVCFCIYFSYRRSWEKAVYLCFLFMATANFAYVLSQIGFIGSVDHTAYSIFLEATNLAAIATIGGSSILKRVRAHADRVGNPNWMLRGLGRFSLALSQDRKRPPFTAFP